MGFMTIDGRKVEFCLRCAIIQKYPPSAPVAYVP